MSKTEANDADDAQTETTTELDHPLEIGTVFTAAAGKAVKVIVNRKQVGPSRWTYKGICYIGTPPARRDVRRYTQADMDANVSEHGWELDAIPGEVSDR